MVDLTASGLQLDLIILKVFSNLNESMIHTKLSGNIHTANSDSCLSLSVKTNTMKLIKIIFFCCKFLISMR